MTPWQKKGTNELSPSRGDICFVVRYWVFDCDVVPTGKNSYIVGFKQLAQRKTLHRLDGACAGNNDSGKRKRRAKRKRNRAGRLFCMMAVSLARSKNIALGAFYRRMAARRGGLIANKALARKLAAWFRRVMVKGDDYVEKGIAHCEEQLAKHRERTLQRLAKQLGRQLVPVTQPT